MGNLNRIRYRGYYWDADIGLYYLQSRYYDPVTCRFINVDSLLDQRSIIGNNMFAYCLNNPTNMTDESGDIPIPIIAAGIGALTRALISGGISAVSQYITTGTINWKVVGIEAIAGAISGALATTGIGLGSSIGINAALGGLTYVAEQAVTGEKIKIGEVFSNTVAGGASGLIGGKGLNAKGLAATWTSASAGINREIRRVNTKYAIKQIAKYEVKKLAVKKSVEITIAKYVAGAIVSKYICWDYGS